MEWLLGPVDLSLLRWFVCSRFRCCVGLYAPGFFGYVVPLGVKEWGAPSLPSRLDLRSLASRLGLQSLASRLGLRSLASWLGLLMMEYVSNVRFLLMPNVDSMGSNGITNAM